MSIYDLLKSGQHVNLFLPSFWAPHKNAFFLVWKAKNGFWSQPRIKLAVWKKEYVENLSMFEFLGYILKTKFVSKNNFWV